MIRVSSQELKAIKAALVEVRDAPLILKGAKTAALGEALVAWAESMELRIQQLEGMKGGS